MVHFPASHVSLPEGKYLPFRFGDDLHPLLRSSSDVNGGIGYFGFEIPLPSMYGIFTYIWLFSNGKIW